MHKFAVQEQTHKTTLDFEEKRPRRHSATMRHLLFDSGVPEQPTRNEKTSCADPTLDDLLPPESATNHDDRKVKAPRDRGSHNGPKHHAA